MKTITRIAVRRGDVGEDAYYAIKSRFPTLARSGSFFYDSESSIGIGLHEVESYLEGLQLTRRPERSSEEEPGSYLVSKERVYEKADLAEFEYLAMYPESMVEGFSTKGENVEYAGCEGLFKENGVVEFRQGGGSCTVVDDRVKTCLEESGAHGLCFKRVIPASAKAMYTGSEIWLLGSTVRMPYQIRMESEAFFCPGEAWFSMQAVRRIEPFDLAYRAWPGFDSGCYGSHIASQRFYRVFDSNELKGFRFSPVRLHFALG